MFKLAVLIVLCGFGYTGYQFHLFESENVVQMQGKIKGMETQLKGKKKKYRELKNFADNIESIKKELRELNIQLQTTLEHMPRDFDLSSILRKLTRLAQNSGVELVDFKPGAKESRNSGSFYATSDISFKVRGAFTHSLVFFDQITRLKRIINIKSLKMRSERVAKSHRNRGSLAQVGTEATITTYRFAE